MSQFGDYIIFVDESGSPTLSLIDPNHPVFVLVFCVINKWTYCDVIQPAVKRLKFEFFGHDMAVLHSRDIRKRSGEFAFLMNEAKRTAFLAELDQIISDASVAIIACVIDKRQAFNFSHPSHNPYHLALRFCMNRLQVFLRNAGQHGRLTHIVAESRGKLEDNLLRDEFDRHQRGSIATSAILEPYYQWLNCELLFAEKKINSAGLQLADLFGHPIGRNAIKSDQPNHAFEIVRRKIFQGIMRFPLPDT